jgi:hypothetical protein
MPAHKLSISLDESVFLAAKRSAERRGMSLSAWLNDVADRALESESSIEAGLAGVAEWEAEAGSPSAEVVAEVNAVLDAAGIGRKRAPRRAA